MLTSLDAIFFDLDGTIIDSEILWLEAMLTLLKRLHISLDDQEVIRIKRLIYGATIFDACATLKHNLKLKDPLIDLIKEAQTILIDIYHKKLHFVPGFLPFYEKVQKNTITTALVTNSDHAILDTVIDLLHLDTLFGKNIFSVTNVSAGKPDPALYRYALKTLSLNPAHCIAIEDSAVGIQAARGADLICIGILNGHNAEQVTKATIIVHNFEEIDTILNL